MDRVLDRSYSVFHFYFILQFHNTHFTDRYFHTFHSRYFSSKFHHSSQTRLSRNHLNRSHKVFANSLIIQISQDKHRQTPPFFFLPKKNYLKTFTILNEAATLEFTSLLLIFTMSFLYYKTKNSKHTDLSCLTLLLI